ncbi:MAG: hypothetical protein D6712_02645 [Chloroflexi bacterium]|nr:MAG: hypothetical protein D6712_02645 [Chloroflexota bacterium]
MAYYLVRAKPNGDLATLRRRLDSGEIQAMRPFGTALDYSLRNARLAADGYAVWEEEDYCTPPLNAERNAVLDTYFTDLSVEPVQAGDGWAKIEALPPLWRD